MLVPRSSPTQTRFMETALTQRATERGFLTRSEVLDFGYLDRHIREAKHSGLLVGIGPGLYALNDTYSAMTLEQQHLARCHAVAHRFGDSVVISHQSSALAHGIATWGVDLKSVNVTRRDGSRGRREAGVIHHIGKIDDSDIVEVDGMLATRPARCVWETACIASIEAGLVTMDSAIHLKAVSQAGLDGVANDFANWQGSRSARITARLADGRAESPGESRSRHLFWRFNLPKPNLQHCIYTSGGLFIARTDFAWLDHRHLGEFDGKVKYDGTYDEDGRQTVFDEKRREDAARGELFGMSRLDWHDLNASRAASTAARLDNDLERSKRLYSRNRTVLV